MLRRRGEERAALPQPASHPDRQLHVQCLFRTLTVSCKTDPRNSLIQDEIWISWFAIIFCVFRTFFSPLYFLLTVNFWDFWHADRGQFWLELTGAKSTSKNTPGVCFHLSLLQCLEFDSVFCAGRSSETLNVRYILPTPRSFQDEAEFKQTSAGLQTPQLGKLGKP